MFKQLVLSCLLVSCLADPLGLPSWVREAGRPRRLLQGCSRAEGRRACGRAAGPGSLAPHAHDCSLFFYCSGPGARPACRRCPGSLHYNPQLQVCDWPENVDCTPRPHPGHGTTPSPATVIDDSTTIDATTPNDAPLTDSTTADATTTNAPLTDDTTTAAPLTDSTTADATTTNAPLTDDTTTAAPLTDRTTTDVTTTDATTTDAPIFTTGAFTWEK